MEAYIYSLLKEKKTSELIEKINEDRKLLDFVDSKGVSLLTLSYYFSNKELREFILTHRSPKDIYEAVICGVKELVILHLNQSSSLLNTYSPDGFTPLGFASYFGRTDIVEFLIEKGADPNIPAANPFRVAPIHSSVASNNFEITKLLLDNGANPNAKQQNNITPLHSAAHLGNSEITKLLLERGADPNATMDDGKTPYDMAKEKNSSEVMILLASGNR
jgi:ankyrin repeat protein